MTQTVEVIPEPELAPLSVVVQICTALERARNPDGMPLTPRQMQNAVRTALLFEGIGN